MAQYEYANGLICYYDGMEDEAEEMEPVLESLAQYPQFWDYFLEAEDPISLEAVDLEAWEIQYKGAK